MLKKAALVVGVVFVAIGVLGFVPGITVDSDGVKKLLGLFEVNTVHNLIHIVSGLAALAASQQERLSRIFFQVMAVVYGLVTVIGLVADGNVLGLFHANVFDNLLHLVLTAAFAYLGFVAKPAARVDAPL